MFYKTKENKENLFVRCEFCHTQIILLQSMCKKRGIYYTISRNLICPECDETSNRVIDEPGILNSMELKKRQFERAKVSKARQQEKERLLKIKKQEEERLLKEKELALIEKARKEKAEAKAEAKALKERKLEEARALKALKTKQQEEARALKKKEREEAKALKIKQLEEAKAIKEKKLLNKKIIASKSLVLFADSEVKMIFLNFINKIETSFLSIGSFVIFERLVFEYNNIGELSLLCSEESLNHYLVYNDIFESFKPNTSLKLIYTEFNEKFLRLVKLIEKKYELQNDENAIYIAWSILRQSLNMYYHNLLANEFGNIFNAKQLTLEECISHYVQIETINVKSANNAGLLTHFLIYEGVTSSNNFIKEYNVVVKLLLKSLEDKKNDDFEKSLLNKNVILDSTAYSIHDTDLMSGNEFELFILELFKKMGYSVRLTKGSGDQGIDVIAERQGRKFGIQAKCYSNTVNNKAIQEVSAGIVHYKLDKGIVITNNYFTKSARELASSNGIVLWDRNILKEKILELY